MNPRLSGPVYLDANFLVAYFVPRHQDHDKSKLRFLELIQKEVKMHISILALDETWYKAYETLQDQIPKNHRKPISQFYSNLKDILDALIKNSLIEIIQFENDLMNGVKKSLENVRDYNFRPRDAFHLALMEDSGIMTIVTKDSHFTKSSNRRKLTKTGIKVISF